MPRHKGSDLISRRSFLGALGTFAAAAPFSLWPLRAQAFFNTGAFMKKRRNGQTSNGYTIGQSLRFNKTASCALTRTNASSGSLYKATFAFWIKHTDMTNSVAPFAVWEPGQGSNPQSMMVIQVGPSNGLYIRCDLNVGGNGTPQFIAQSQNQLLRDPSAWYHVVVSFDTSNASASERLKAWINGTPVTFYAPSAYPWIPPQNTNIYTGANGYLKGIMQWTTSNVTNYYDGYLSEICFVDGYTLDSTSFGQTDTNTGQWIPKKYTGTYGTNGFYLPFNDATSTTTLGYDRQVSLTDSSKNNWTPSGLNTYDQVLDSPTNNFSILNPLSSVGTATLSGANLTVTTGTTNVLGKPSSLFVTSGLWYWEITPTASGSGEYMVGVIKDGFTADNANNAYTYMWYSYSPGPSSLLLNNGGSSAYTGSTAFTTNDTIGVALDLTAGTLAFYKNGVSQGIAFSGLAGSFAAIAADASSANGATYVLNFGQGGQSGLTYNSASGGRFKYTPPAGFKALCTANLSAPAVKNPTQYFSTFLYSGTGSTLMRVSPTGSIFGTFLSSYSSRTPAAAFDGNTSQGNTAAAVADAAPSYIGKAFSAPTTLSRVVAISASDTGFSNIIGQTITIQVYGSNTLPTSATNGTLVASTTVTDARTTLTATIDFTAASYQYWWINVTEPTFNGVLLSELQYFAPSAEIGFQPDLVWIKDRDGASNPHSIYDSVRTAGKRLASNLTNQEYSASNLLTSFDSNGFSVGSDGELNYSGHRNVAWCWKAGGTASANNAGTTTSQVSANTATGFSIVKYVGPGTATTVGHGLGLTPSFIIIKDRTSANEWCVYHKSLSTPQSSYLMLQSTNAVASSTAIWNNTAPTSSVFSIGAFNWVNYVGGANNYIAYLWAEVSGFSKFGSYTGNSSADGPFVYCGFKPRWILVKDASGPSATSWAIIDSARDSANPVGKWLWADGSNAETAYDSTRYVDFLSNGFKIRSSSAGHALNDSSAIKTYIFAAFAESPFKYATAR